MLEIQEYNGVISAKGETPRRRGSMGVYVFLCDNVLIDTGSKSLLKIYIPFFREAEFNQVMITHHHEDHTGGARWLQNEKKVPIFIHEAALEICHKKGDYPLYRQAVWGVRDAFSPRPLPQFFESEHSLWEAIHTPGHAFDHFAFLNKTTGTLFSGDIYVNPRPRLMLSFESVPTIMRSLERLLTYDFKEMFCSHSGYHENGKQTLKRKLDYMKEKSEEIIHLYKQGLTAKEIQEKLMPKKHPLILFSNHEWGYQYFITSVLAELQAKNS